MRSNLSMSKLSNKHLFYSFLIILVLMLSAGFGAGLRIFDKEEHRLFNSRVVARLYFHVAYAIHDTHKKLIKFKETPTIDNLEDAYLRIDASFGQISALKSEAFILDEFETKSFQDYLKVANKILTSARNIIEGVLTRAESIEGYEFQESDFKEITKSIVILERLSDLNLELESEFWQISAYVYGDITSSFDFKRAVYVASLSGLTICLIGFLVILVLKIRSDERLEEKNVELVNNYRLANLGEFAANVAHEINNPLTVLLWSVKRLEKNTVDEEEKKRFNMIKNQAQRIDQIIKGIKLLSKNSNHLNNSPIDVDRLFDQLQELVIHKCSANNIALNIEGDCDGCQIWGKEVQILQVLTNFVSNSVDAIEEMEKGRITIRYESNSDNQLIIHIIDTGKGIELKDQKKLFAYMYTTKPEAGMGIGLALSTQIIESMNGHIKYLNEEKNTTFEIMLPLYRNSSKYKSLKS
ncbi:sensor histidine kinase [Halobacteriovorax sp. GFR8]